MVSAQCRVLTSAVPSVKTAQVLLLIMQTPSERSTYAEKEVGQGGGQNLESSILVNLPHGAIIMINPF